jgi:ribonuclease-3
MTYLVSIHNYIFMRNLFNNPEIFTLAMTHCGLVGEDSNQRLEFLGDRVLGLIIADMIYRRFPDANEGELARRHAALVCGETLSGIAKTLGLGEHLRLSEGDDNLGVRDSMATLEDACEALIGALYLDGGIEVVTNFVHQYWGALLDVVQAPPKDGKTKLQEWVQGQGLPLPNYELLKREGADHSPIFTIEVRVVGLESSLGVASSKRAAEQIAADNLLKKYKVE